MGPRQLLLPPNTYVLLSPGTYVTVCLSPPTSIVKGCSACTWTWGEGGGGGGVGEHTHSRAVPSQCLGAVLEPDLGQRADAIVREELILVQHVSQHPQQPLLGGDGQEVAELPITKRVQVGDLDKVEKSHHLLSLLSPPLPPLTCLDRSSLLVRNHWSLLRKPGSLWMTSSSSTRQA